MPKTKQTEETAQTDPTLDLIKGLLDELKASRPERKKTAAERKPKTPWTPKDGSPKLKLRRKVYQHGLLIDPDMETNETIELLNQIKPGRYLDGWVKVVRRRDRGIDIDYPIKTAAQRLRLVNQFGIRNFNELLQRCIDEGNNPAKYVQPEED